MFKTILFLLEEGSKYVERNSNKKKQHGPEARKNKQECVRGLNTKAVELNGEVLNHLGFFLGTNRESLKDFKEIGWSWWKWWSW